MFGEALYGEILFGGKRISIIERVLNLPIVIFNFVSRTGGLAMFIRTFIERGASFANFIRKFLERQGALPIFIRKHLERISSFANFLEGIKQALKVLFYPIRVKFRVKNQ